MDLYSAIEWYGRGTKAIYSCGDCYETLSWHEENILPKPTETDLKLAWHERSEDYTNKEYQRKRLEAYPPLDTQLDVMYNHGFDAWRKHIYSIKAKYPSPKGTVKPTFDNPLEPIEKRMTVIETQFETDMKHAKQEMADLQAAIIDTKGAIYAIKGFMMEIPNIQKQLNIIQEKLEGKDATS